MAITKAGQQLLQEHAIAQSRITELETLSQKLPSLRDNLQQMQVERKRLAEIEETLRQKRQSNQELRAQFHQMGANKSRLEKEIEEIAEKLNLLATQSDAKCPLCETELGTGERRRIEAKYSADRDNKSHALKSNRAELAQKKLEIDSLEGEISQLEAILDRDRASVQSRIGILNKEVIVAEEASKNLKEMGEKLVEIEQHLAKKDFAIVEQKALNEVDSELARLSYDSQQHEQVRNRLAKLEQYETAKRKLEEADRLINQERETAFSAEQATQELRHNLEADNQKRQIIIGELAMLPQLDSDLAQAEAEHQALVKQQKQVQEVVWSVQAKLQRCSELELKKRKKERLLDRFAKQENIYRDLAQAFGKRGVQALLIEIALPEIESEANKLLGRMTDNRMQVKIETQRETKAGNLLETLDINISDELGTRNYEMFSGGEAFRINFAIRIALSKLLARRAGAPLPTLVIDEGFGTQDSVGIEKIKEGINSIQDDFEKIIVITHIDELKDAFPARIEVVKTADGSTLEVS